MQLSQNEDHDFSLSRFESMLKTNDVLFFDTDEFSGIILHYLDIGKMRLAKKAVRLGLAQHPTSTTLRLFNIEILIFENKLELAESYLDKLFELEPSNEEVYIQKANIYSKKNNHEAAIETLQIALNKTHDPTEIYSLIGMEFLFSENYEQAKYNFMKCLELDEEDYAALYNIMYCFDFLEQRKEAIAYLNIFLDKNPYSEVAWHQIGRQYFDLKQYEKALNSFDFAIISDEYFIGAYLEKGKVLEKLNRFEEAIENYKITLELDDPTAFAYLRIGKCFEKGKQTKKALYHYKKAVHEDPLLDKGWLAITDFHMRAKEFRKALFYIKKALGIDQENVRYWKRFAQINHRLCFYEEAANAYQKTLELGNYELDTWLTHADLLLQIGEPQQAANNLLQAIEFYPDSAEIDFRLCGLYFALNKAEKGYFHLKNGLKENADFSIILDELFPALLQRKSIKILIDAHS